MKYLKYHLYDLDKFNEIYISDILSNNIKYICEKEGVICYINYNKERYLKLTKDIDIERVLKIFLNKKYEKYENVYITTY